MTRPILMALLVWLPAAASAQSLDFSAVLSAEKPDAERYLSRFIGPFMKGFGHGLTNGWHNTARTHEFAGFDLSFTGSMVLIPQQDLLFEVAGFQSLVPDNDSDLPTVFGPKADNRLSYSNTLPVTYTDPETNTSVTTPATIAGVFDAVDGLDLENEIGTALLPVPMAQAGVGLFRSTDLKVRWIPPVQTDDFDFDLLGLALRHDIQQWLPPSLRLPIDASVLVGWTHLSARGDLSRARGGLDGAHQIASYSITATTYQLLASKDVSIFTVFGGAGFDANHANLSMTGEYIIEGTTRVNGQSVPATGVLVDPLDLDINDGGFRSSLGIRVKLLTMTAHVEYAFQSYNTVTMGVGISVR